MTKNHVSEGFTQQVEAAQAIVETRLQLSVDQALRHRTEALADLHCMTAGRRHEAHTPTDTQEQTDEHQHQ